MIPSIGFDFDECLANAYSITPFIILLESLIPATLAKQTAFEDDVLLKKSRLVFYQAVADNEVATKGTIFRPSFLKLLPKLLELKNQGRIKNLFIYSNNGIPEVINMVDHILALVLHKAYNVPLAHLVKDELMQVFTPRVHLNAACRSVEVKDSKEFREKSLEGINACLAEPITESSLWYLDDTRYHTRLINQIKDRYVVVEPYSVHLSNRRVGELFIESYPVGTFKPNLRIGSLVLTEMNRLMPGFRPTGYETRERILDKLLKVLNTFSPESGGKVFSRWKEDHINKDYKLIEQGLQGAMNPSDSKTPSAIINRPLTYNRSGSSPSGGSRPKSGKTPYKTGRLTRKRQ